MTRVGVHSFLAGLLAFLASQSDSTAATNQTPDFKEVYELIRSHVPGVSDEELNRAAVQGLLTALSPKVLLVTNSPSTNAPAETLLVSKAHVLEGKIAYLRITRVSGGLAEEVSMAHRHLNSSNVLEGVVLDLRYTDGGDYQAAAATADLFTAKAGPLLNWGAGVESSHEKTNAIRVPVAVLVNHETARAAEALAALLRETGAGLILGGRTAGQAMIAQDFPLSDGGRLRIATAPVTLGDGTALPATGIKPDIAVTVSAEDERAYYADAFQGLERKNPVAGGKLSTPAGPDGTNPALRHSRLNEAELVREHKEGLDRDLDANMPPARPSEPAKPVVNDPALARALDLLNGLAVVRQDHR
jgi:hypothetical protein